MSAEKKSQLLSDIFQDLEQTYASPDKAADKMDKDLEGWRMFIINPRSPDAAGPGSQYAKKSDTTVDEEDFFTCVSKWLEENPSRSRLDAEPSKNDYEQSGKPAASNAKQSMADQLRKMADDLDGKSK